MKQCLIKYASSSNFVTKLTSIYDYFNLNVILSNRTVKCPGYIAQCILKYTIKLLNKGKAKIIENHVTWKKLLF